MPLIYRCCPCKQLMPREGGPNRPFDPSDLVLVTNVDRDRRDQKEQDFPCHFEGFRGMGFP